MSSMAPARFTYSNDPSGRELRRALLIPARPPVRGEVASLLMALAAALVLTAGLLRVVTVQLPARSNSPAGPDASRRCSGPARARRSPPRTSHC